MKFHSTEGLFLNFYMLHSSGLCLKIRLKVKSYFNDKLRIEEYTEHYYHTPLQWSNHEKKIEKLSLNQKKSIAKT